MDSRRIYQLKSSAAAALTPSLTVLIGGLVMLPARAAINYVFGGSTETNWKVALEVIFSLALIWFFVSLVSNFSDLYRSDKIATAKDPSFGAQSFIAGLYGCTIIFSVILAVGMHREGDSLWMQLIPLIFLALSLYAWPRKIYLDDTTLRQRTLWAREKVIPYSSVQAISTEHGGNINVLGVSEVITHSSYHADPDSFRYFVAQRTGKKVY